MQPAAYGGYKDASEAWVAGVLALGAGSGAGDSAAAVEVPEALQELWAERAAMMVCEGKLPPAEAARWAWVCLQPQEGKQA